ncbi:uncharacterized protein OCT59_021652 [Rhizophagus irregularis]|uniref:Uncharacterized protein n=1 Tax=Rhizophagus irregularis TaxID=588596 RepID=A0A915ZH23_9GLOM|nr:hypothetical protein OCT59_021652 [Rhizophagus irregularis]CAB5192520.1 unnamed protein product [Rhizophagus irregularis]CAB5376655.1 unnamed protein product [Rhizophagus irregularis]
MYITITSVSRATSPASVSTITSGDSFSTITSSNFSSDFDPFLNYKIFTNSRITINMDNPSEQIPSISQFEEDFDNLSKLVDEKNKNMDNFNQNLIDVVNNDYNGNINFINEGMNQDSSAIVSPREEERTKESQNKFQQNDDNFNNEVTKFNDNQSTMSTLEEQKSSDDPITLPQAEQIANMLIDINNNKITSNNIFSSNNENDITCNTLVLPKPNTSSTFDDTLDNRNLISENIVLDNYNKMQSFDVRNGNDLILSYIDKDNMEIQQEDDEICLKRDNEINKESTNNEFNNDNNNERKEIVDIKTKVKQEYGRITLALKDQLALYNKFREVIPENVRKQVENTVGVISFTYHQPNQTDGVHVTSDDPMGESIPQENDSDFLSSTESNSSEQNQVKVKKSTRTMNGYNYYIKKQFKKSKNKSRKARDVISSSAKKWLELPANIKKHYQSKAKLGREKVSVKQNRLYGRKNQQPRQPRIDTPGENESEVLAVVIPIDSELRYKFQ